MLIKGSALTSQQRAQVLAAFVHRPTVESARSRGVACAHCAQIPQWPYVTGQALPDGPHVWTRDQWHTYHTTHGAIDGTDQQWLEAHAFHFLKDGSRLMERRHAEPAS
jgi:phospholipase C